MGKAELGDLAVRDLWGGGGGGNGTGVVAAVVAAVFFPKENKQRLTEGFFSRGRYQDFKPVLWARGGDRTAAEERFREFFFRLRYRDQFRWGSETLPTGRPPKVSGVVGAGGNILRGPRSPGTSLPLPYGFGEFPAIRAGIIRLGFAGLAFKPWRAGRRGGDGGQAGRDRRFCCEP